MTKSAWVHNGVVVSITGHDGMAGKRGDPPHESPRQANAR